MKRNFLTLHIVCYNFREIQTAAMKFVNMWTNRKGLLKDDVNFGDSLPCNLQRFNKIMHMVTTTVLHWKKTIKNVLYVDLQAYSNWFALLDAEFRNCFFFLAFDMESNPRMEHLYLKRARKAYLSYFMLLAERRVYGEISDLIWCQ